MTTVDTQTSIYDQLGINGSTQATKETGVNNIDQAGFLKLMTAQLQYQDPFSPMDNTQMVQQMATFTSLANQDTSNGLLKSISDSMSSGRLSDAAGWIGRSMLVKSDIATPDRTGTYGGEITLQTAATNLSVDLVDASGKTVKTLDLGAQKAGPVNFYWDGMEGEEYTAGGPLQVKINGGVASQTATWATIAAVQSPASGTDAKLMTPLGNFTPADAIKLG
jgi:flagellar basal-body rod modification protein FlgD